jgi:hypothetical protein
MIKREKIRLYAGVPKILRVEDVRGTQAHSSLTGDETRFKVINEGVPSDLYLPRAYGNAIAASGAQPGDEIQVLKTGTNGEVPVYRVRLVSDAHLPVPVLHERPQDAAPQPVAQPIRMLAPRAQEAPRLAAPPTAQTVPTSHPMVDLMTRCLIVGYQANQNAYEQLRARGIEIDPPTWEDVRATGTSLFIERNKQSRGN